MTSAEYRLALDALPYGKGLPEVGISSIPTSAT